MRLVFWMALSLLTTSGLPAQTVRVGDSAHPEALADALAAAYAGGARDITLQPGTYVLPSRAPHATLDLPGWHDATVHAEGVTLIFSELRQHPLLIRDSTNVTWQGGTLRFALPAFTQGRVVAMGADTQGPYCDWRIDDGYPTTLQEKTIFNIVDQHTRQLKVGVGDWYPEPRVLTAKRTMRFRYAAAHAPGCAVGDWLVARAETGTMVVVHANCNHCTTQDVTIQNAGFGAFFETDGPGANRYLHCTVEPGPKPDGATEDELVGGGADGFHSNGTRIGPDIEDCAWRGVFLDDCIAVHGFFQQVERVEGPRLRLEARPVQLRVGDPLRIADMRGFFAEGTIREIGPTEGPSLWLTLDQDLHVPIDPSGAQDKRKGTQAGDPDACGAGYRILRCHLGDTRSRGILVKGDHGQIEDCTIEGCGMSGVSIGPEFWWGEAGYSWHVSVSRNTFINCGQVNQDQSTLYVHGDGAMGNRDITIQNNTFRGCYGPAVIGCSFVDGANVVGNRFEGSFPLPCASGEHELFFAHARHVRLGGNSVTKAAASAGQLVQFGEDVTPADIQGNDASGIRIANPAGP